MDGLKKILRKVLPIAAGAAAVATGNPALAVAAYSATSAATAKKAKAPPVIAPPVAPIVQPGGLLDNLSPTDRNVVLVGGGIIGALVLAKIMSPPRRSRARA